MEGGGVNDDNDDDDDEPNVGGKSREPIVYAQL